MRPGVLRRRVPLAPTGRLHRKPRKPGERVTPTEARQVFERDGYRCIQGRFDVGHRCTTRLSIEHVPGFNENAMGSRGRYLVTACLEANGDWCLTHRADERQYLVAIGVMPPLGEGTDAHAGVAPD